MKIQVEAAISDALAAGKALCKFISRNDAGLTGSHQCGFYLPKSAWQMFSPQAPVKDLNHKSIVRVNWPGDVSTESAVTWYGSGTRSEYRLTRFGKNFEWLGEDYVGALLVIIPFSLELFHAYVLNSEEEIELLQAALGIETLGEWAVYTSGHEKIETEDECLQRVFTDRISELEAFPTGAWMADSARLGVQTCQKSSVGTPDATLLKWLSAEYQLFRLLERKLCLADIAGPFKEVDDFISKAATIMNRRKSRAGHSLENHVCHLLKSEGIVFEGQARIDGKVRPDILIPGRTAYENPDFPDKQLMVVGLKTTCKDRWRQILSEGRRIPEKHLLTLQEAISADQLREMNTANVTLVVPERFHGGYDTSTGIRLLTVGDFIDKVKTLAA
ncbi:type II restriction endonuclease [Luteolibacter luteus]|uniref:Restriction endonuclease n=1 Tax=Luteolibacter luteus TaxID=2728835 RepID=A0A858REX7_9BACT|nr:type II restriction endonuclease [Luteolibacter luteus]QJE94979.1 restriction endonuclease [Luteolibacter luteus]